MNKKIEYYYGFMYKDNYINKDLNETKNMFEVLDINIKEKSQLKKILNNQDINKYKSDLNILKIKCTTKNEPNSITIKDNCTILETISKVTYKEFLLGKLK